MFFHQCYEYVFFLRFPCPPLPSPLLQPCMCQAKHAIHSNLQPGGYFEIVDILITPTSDDASLSPTSHTVRWNKLIAEVSASLGRPLLITAQYSSLAKSVGFEDVQEVVRNVPGKPWGEEGTERRLGSLSRDVHATVSERLGIDMLVKGIGWEEEGVRARLEGVMGELGDEGVHTVWPL